jgi:peptidoglycan/xylan/chitin deacetylase (PgdA/CDA1 family)
MANDHVANICFHGIGTPKRELEPGEDRYWVSTEQFQAVLDEVLTWPSVRISFDDGNTSDLEIGLPALQDRGLTADFFVLAGRLGTPGCLDEAAVCELHAAGMAIGSHGMRHQPWPGLTAGDQHEELVAARDRLSSVTGTAVASAACPLGRYDRRVLRQLRQLGYTRIYTSDRQRARSQAWLQPRYSVRRDDTPASLREEALVGPALIGRLRLQAVGAIKRLR